MAATRRLRKEDGTTVLMAAAEENNVDAVRLMLDKDVNIQAANNEGWTAMHAAEGRAKGERSPEQNRRPDPQPDGLPVDPASATDNAAKDALQEKPWRMTAQQIIERVQNNLGLPWKASKLDGFAAGSPETTVTGIATTFTPTVEVLRRAASGGKNLIISREPVFYLDPRYTGGPAPAREEFDSNPTVRFKRDFIAEHGLVVWRFFENWNARRTDGQLRALAAAMNGKGITSPGLARNRIRQATTSSLCRELHSKQWQRL